MYVFVKFKRRSFTRQFEVICYISKENLWSIVMEKIKHEAVNYEDGEVQLSSLIKQAGNEARNRRKQALDEHFNKLKKVVSDAMSSQKESIR